ncbi:MAG: zinc transporter ZntB, partial [Kofleriaceae bacterium]|nr:zinc transporter ZntB [Kofleriaceae bacterium]
AMTGAGTLGDTGLATAVVLDGKGGGKVLDWDGVRRWQRGDGVLWLNLDYAGDDVQAWLRDEAGLEPLVQSALLERDPRPRAIVHDDDRLLMIIRAINLNQGAEPEDMVSLRCWFEPDRILTLRHRRLRASKGVLADLERGRGPRDGGELLARMVEFILEPMVTQVDHIDEAVDTAEDQIVAGHGDRLRANLAAARRQAISLRRFIAPQREAWVKLPGLPLAWLHGPVRDRLREAADRLTRTVEELDAARDRAVVAYEELTSQVGELTNKRLYLLSIVTALFLPLGFVTSLLGVNVGGVPGQHVEWGFWVLLGLFLLATGTQLWWLRRRGWFRDH